MSKRPLEAAQGFIALVDPNPTPFKKPDGETMHRFLVATNGEYAVSGELICDGFGVIEKYGILMIGIFYNNVMTVGTLHVEGKIYAGTNFRFTDSGVYGRLLAPGNRFREGFFGKKLQRMPNSYGWSSNGTSTFKGYFDENGVMSGGSGVFTRGDFIFSGSVKGGKLNGPGFTKNIKIGILWRGIFENDKLISGTHTLSNGTTLTGSFRKSLLHGYGVVTFPDGKVLKGEFIDGQISLNLSVKPDGEFTFT